MADEHATTATTDDAGLSTAVPPVGHGSLLGLPRQFAALTVSAMLVAAVVYSAWWGTTPEQNTDSVQYLATASDLSDGRLEQMPNVAPGYPLLLIVTGSTDGPGPALFFTQLVAYFAVAWLVLALSVRFELRLRWRVVLLAALLSPPLVEWTAAVYTETLTTLLVTLGVYLAVRWVETDRLGWLVGVGVASLAATVLLVGAVSVHNGVRFDYPATTPLAGWHLLTRTAPFLEQADQTPLTTELIAMRNEKMLQGDEHEPYVMLWLERERVEAATGMSPRELDRELLRLDARLIAQNPLDYLLAVGNVAPTFVFPSASTKATGGHSAVQLLFAVASFAVVALFVVQVLLVAALAVARRVGASFRTPLDRPETRLCYVLVLGLAAYLFVVSTAFDIGLARYRVPLDPLLLLVTFGGWRAVSKAVAGLDRHGDRRERVNHGRRKRYEQEPQMPLSNAER